MFRKKFAQKLTGSAFHFLLLLSLGEGQVGHALFSLVLPPPMLPRRQYTTASNIYTTDIEIRISRKVLCLISSFSSVLMALKQACMQIIVPSVCAMCTAHFNTTRWVHVLFIFGDTRLLTCINVNFLV